MHSSEVRHSRKVMEDESAEALAKADNDHLQFFYGQATKGVRWMPRQREAMKDAVSCDKLR